MKKNRKNVVGLAPLLALCAVSLLYADCTTEETQVYNVYADYPEYTNIYTQETINNIIKEFFNDRGNVAFTGTESAARARFDSLCNHLQAPSTWTETIVSPNFSFSVVLSQPSSNPDSFPVIAKKSVTIPSYT
ncbi:MAG: hypothetical protein LBT01_09120 [Spirochaetaceae bacterium]|jgi:hypothetical protein|nr:hypothetical protein [Spirochaetaceae bacterium]